MSDTLYEKIPERLNYLLWLPELYTEPGKEETVEFYTGDTKGISEVPIRQTNVKGEVVIVGKCELEVK